jgi:hypothetical protein
MNGDATAGAPRLDGFMTSQVGAGTYDASALAPGSTIFELWGATGTVQPIATTSLGFLHNAVAATGSINLYLDVVDQATPTLGQLYEDGVYTVAANGRVSFTFGAGPRQRHLAMYLNGQKSAYMLETTGTEGGFGFIEPQVGDPTQPLQPFSTFVGGIFLGATIFPASVSPITLFPSQSLGNGTLAGNLSGVYAVDPVTGRGLATFDRNLLGGLGGIFYIVNANKFVMMGDGVNALTSSMGVFQY